MTAGVLLTRSADADVRAWRPRVAGIAEVFHARFVDHAYPAHTHDAWTLLIVDDGAISYELGHHDHGVLRSTVTLLPPDVPHDGRPATPQGFRKRVIYLEPSVLELELVGAAVDDPGWRDPLLRRRVDQLHRALARPGDEFEAESRLTLIRDRLADHLRHRDTDTGEPVPRGLAERLRELLDARVAAGVTLGEAGRILHAHPAHLVRAFSRRYGLPPHRYLTGRRVDLARRLLLAGQPPAEVATAAGFYDQAHLTRQFRRYLGISPARYEASAR
jgi:AraC-like DNA-binding protein